MSIEKNKQVENEDYKYFWIITIISIVIVFSLWTWNWLALNEYPNETRGTHGDMFGAVNAVFSGLAFAGIIISLYLQRIDLKNQFKEIKKTNEEFEIQNKTLQVQKFENQYYKMIDLHKANVSEFIIPYTEHFKAKQGKSNFLSDKSQRTNLIGRKCFVDLFKELNICLKICFDSLDISIYEHDDISYFAYQIFFWGINSDFVDSTKISYDDYNKISNLFINLQKNYSNRTTYSDKKYNIRYIPFQGHESRLAHYYRHLFQTVKYIVETEEKKLISYDESRQYLRVLRSQLSNSEQLMLYYNYICGFGKEWDKKGKRGNRYLTHYRMIHNLPIDRVDIVEKPRIHFEKYIIEIQGTGETLFEWGDL